VAQNSENKNNRKWLFFYHDVNDPRLFVPKQRRMLGWTLNFGNKVSWLVLFLLLAFVITVVYSAVQRLMV
jgi:uncharacterized membrane protein